jgi:choline monooxygenase
MTAGPGEPTVIHDFHFEDDLARATTLPSEWYVDSGMLAREREAVPVRSPSPDSLYRRHLQAERAPEALYYRVFPNLMLNVYPDNLQLNIIVPLGPERTLTRFEWLFRDPGRPGLAEEFERSFAFSDEVQQEDIAICEAVQKGLRARFYDRGRFSVRRENGVHHFHGLLASALDRQGGSQSG